MNFKCKILLLIIFITCLACNSETTSETNQKTAPTFSIDSLDKTTKISIDEYKNTSIVLNFWFPSCPPCKTELSYLQQIYEEFAGSIQFIGIQQIGIDSPQDGLILIKEKGITYNDVDWEADRRALLTEKERKKEDKKKKKKK